MANTEWSSMRSLSGKRSCCSRSSYSSAPWWRWAAAALADWRSPCSSHRGPLLFYCAPLAHRQEKEKKSVHEARFELLELCFTSLVQTWQTLRTWNQVVARKGWNDRMSTIFSLVLENNLKIIAMCEIDIP